jgi:hypothetical protein
MAQSTEPRMRFSNHWQNAAAILVFLQSSSLVASGFSFAMVGSPRWTGGLITHHLLAGLYSFVRFRQSRPCEYYPLP